VEAVVRLDDGKTDAVSLAYGIQPQCAAYYQQVLNEQVAQMITENAQIAQRQFVSGQELKLITSEILAQRAKRRS